MWPSWKFALDNREIVTIPKAYVAKVINTVNDLDNVLYEVSNESPVTPANTAWQYEIIRYVKEQIQEWLIAGIQNIRILLSRSAA